MDMRAYSALVQELKDLKHKESVEAGSDTIQELLDEAERRLSEAISSKEDFISSQREEQLNREVNRVKSEYDFEIFSKRIDELKELELKELNEINVDEIQVDSEFKQEYIDSLEKIMETHKKHIINGFGPRGAEEVFNLFKDERYSELSEVEEHISQFEAKMEKLEDFEPLRLRSLDKFMGLIFPSIGLFDRLERPVFGFMAYLVFVAMVFYLISTHVVIIGVTLIATLYFTEYVGNRKCIHAWRDSKRLSNTIEYFKDDFFKKRSCEYETLQQAVREKFKERVEEQVEARETLRNKMNAKIIAVKETFQVDMKEADAKFEVSIRELQKEKKLREDELKTFEITRKNLLDRIRDTEEEIVKAKTEILKTMYNGVSESSKILHNEFFLGIKEGNVMTISTADCPNLFIVSDYSTDLEVMQSYVYNYFKIVDITKFELRVFEPLKAGKDFLLFSSPTYNVTKFITNSADFKGEISKLKELAEQRLMKISEEADSIRSYNERMISDGSKTMDYVFAVFVCVNLKDISTEDMKTLLEIGKESGVIVTIFTPVDLLMSGEYSDVEKSLLESAKNVYQVTSFKTVRVTDQKIRSFKFKSS